MSERCIDDAALASANQRMLATEIVRRAHQHRIDIRQLCVIGQHPLLAVGVQRGGSATNRNHPRHRGGVLEIGTRQPTEQHRRQLAAEVGCEHACTELAIHGGLRNWQHQVGVTRQRSEPRNLPSHIGKRTVTADIEPKRIAATVGGIDSKRCVVAVVDQAKARNVDGVATKYVDSNGAKPSDLRLCREFVKMPNHRDSV